jgi:hypothetical protein
MRLRKSFFIRASGLIFFYLVIADSAGSAPPSDSIDALMHEFYAPYFKYGNVREDYPYTHADTIKKYLTPSFASDYSQAAHCGFLGENPFTTSPEPTWLKSLRVVINRNDGLHADVTAYLYVRDPKEPKKDAEEPWPIEYQLVRSGGNWLIDDVWPLSDPTSERAHWKVAIAAGPCIRARKSPDWIPEERK